MSHIQEDTNDMASTSHGWNFQVNTPPRIIIVGGGLAGLSATLEAVNQGAHVTLIEKNPKLGGNSEKASSGMNAVGTEAQKNHGVTDDSVEIFKHDTMQSGHGKADEALVDTLVHSSHDAIKFIESYGVSLDKVSQCGGHSKPRTHRPGPGPDGKVIPVGQAIMKTLSAKVQSLSDSVNILLETYAVQLLTESVQRRGSSVGIKRVSGIQVKNDSKGVFDIKGDAVILTSGGYGGYRGQESLLQKHAPHVSYLPSTNGEFASGDGVKLAKEVGALLRHMQHVQVHPTGFVNPKDPDNNTKFLAPEALRGVGGLLINPKTGKRFVNELGRRDDVTKAIQSECGRYEADGKWNESCYLFLTEEAAKEFGPTFGFYHKVKGFFQEFNGIKETVETLGVSEQSLKETIHSYTEQAASGNPDSFGKETFPNYQSFKPLANGDTSLLYVAIITPSIHYTMGGIAINAAGEALGIPDSFAVDGYDVSLEDSSSLSQVETGLEAPAPTDNSSGTRPSAKMSHFQPQPIPGLFAAGEASGGVHGGNRLAGNSLLECVVYGRIAGKRSASFRNMTTSCMNQSDWTSLRLRESFTLCADQYIFRFDLPSPMHTVAGNADGRAGGAVGKYIKVRANVEGEEIIRCYSPASRLGALGYIDLLVKIDPHGGKMSYHLREMRPGDTLDFSGLHGKLSLDFRASSAASDGGVPYEGRSLKKINLLAGGTGIAPMLSILHSVLHHKRTDIDVKLLYGANQPAAIAFKDGLDSVGRHSNVDINYTVDRVPEGQSWEGHVGFIDEQLIQKTLSPPGDDVLVVICGPYKMCQVLKDLVKKVGYTSKMVYCYM